MENYIPIIAVAGCALLGMAWMPGLTKIIKISYSIVYVLIGVLLYRFTNFLPEADPLEYKSFSVRLTELMVIVSLMGTGLKIDEPFSFKSWKVPLKLVSITMLLSIGIVILIGIYWLNLDVASAVLLGAVLAPTDPVLADDVQVGPPLEKKKNDVRFSLTAEAGLNDGMAFPFTWLAITLALIAAHKADFTHWLLYDLGYRIGMGVVIGFAIGRLMAYLIFDLPQKRSFLKTRDGFVAFSLTLLVYGVTELTHGYGWFCRLLTHIACLRCYRVDAWIWVCRGFCVRRYVEKP
jgi:sodium/hydrogen antiporter